MMGKQKPPKRAEMLKALGYYTTRCVLLEQQLQALRNRQQEDAPKPGEEWRAEAADQRFGEAMTSFQEAMDKAAREPEPIDYTQLDGPALLEACGDSGKRWARAFLQHLVHDKDVSGTLYEEIDEGWVMGWFANAIEHSYQLRQRRERELEISLSGLGRSVR